MTTIGIVTGAASGMGRACVDRLLGTVDHLLAVDLAPVDIPGTESVDCDVRSDDAVGTLVDRVRSLGTFRFLVNAAGLSPTMADPRTIVDVNLVGTARLLDAFDPLVTAGSVAVPFSSSAGYLQEMLNTEQLALLGRTRDPDVLDDVATLISDSGIAYLYSKVGVQLEARTAAARWAPRGGRVVSLSPGNIDTPMGRLELEHQPLMREAQAAHPMQRLGDPREIAAVVAFLVSDDASFVNGVDVLVDGAERAQGLGSAVTR
jgi:NAD(P)-dependent dehydrogenase (short-subunit alcohol dehydrogenase family)